MVEENLLATNLPVQFDPKNFSILIVDDEVDFIEPIAYWFASKGYEISKVNSGKVALDIIKKG